MQTKLVRPSPALVVSLIALFVALGGSGYAAVKLNGKSLKNGSVAGKKLKNRSIAGKKLKNNTVTGRHIKESTLGKVPLAAQADNATSATNATNATTAGSATSFGGMTAQRIDPFTLSDNGTREVAKVGPFTLTASCTIDDAGEDTALINVTTSQSNSAIVGEDEDADFDIGDTVPWVTAETFTGTGTPEIAEDPPLLIAPDGTEIFGYQLYAGVNIFGQPGVCRFGGVILVG
jgi:hypothetical protein